MKEKLVYIISNPAWPEWYKVGIATNWKTRWKSYNTSSPFRDYKFEYGVTTADWKSVEKSMHGSFPGHREWLNADLEELKIKLNQLTKETDYGN